MGERDERRHLPTEPDEATTADVVRAVAAFVDDLVEEEADPDPDPDRDRDRDLDPEEDVAGGYGAP